MIFKIKKRLILRSAIRTFDQYCRWTLIAGSKLEKRRRREEKKKVVRGEGKKGERGGAEESGEQTRVRW
jgi:hypothetical protein